MRGVVTVGGEYRIKRRATETQVVFKEKDELSIQYVCLCCSHRVLNISPTGISDMGPVQWELALCLLGAWIIAFLCMIKGIKSSGKVFLCSNNDNSIYLDSCDLCCKRFLKCFLFELIILFCIPRKCYVHNFKT